MFMQKLLSNFFLSLTAERNMFQSVNWSIFLKTGKNIIARTRQNQETERYCSGKRFYEYWIQGYHSNGYEQFYLQAFDTM
jgi:hypothetical protein